MRTTNTNLTYNSIIILPSNYAFDGSFSAPECRDYHGETTVICING